MQTICLYAASALTALVGLGCALGSFVLARGGASEWPDIVASDVVLKRIAVGLAIASSLLLASSAGLFLHVPWAVQAALLALLIFVSGGFWGNYAAFGEFRRMHIGTNIIVAAIIVVLLWLSAGTPT